MGSQPTHPLEYLLSIYQANFTVYNKLFLEWSCHESIQVNILLLNYCLMREITVYQPEKHISLQYFSNHVVSDFLFGIWAMPDFRTNHCLYVVGSFQWISQTVLKMVRDEFWIIRTEVIRSLKRFVQKYRFRHDSRTKHSLTHWIIVKTVSPAVKLENI